MSEAVADLVIRAPLDPALIPPKPAKITVLAVVTGDPIQEPALCAVRYDTHLITPGDPMCGEEPVFETRYTLLATHRMAPGQSYPVLAQTVNRTAKRLWNRDAAGDYHILVDASGIGKPVVDAIRQSIIPQAHVTGVTVTNSDKGDLSILWRDNATIGLAYIVSRLQAILQGGRLAIPPTEAALLASLADFTVEQAETAYLVRALALCCSSENLRVMYDVSPDALPSPDY